VDEVVQKTHQTKVQKQKKTEQGVWGRATPKPLRNASTKNFPFPPVGGQQVALIARSASILVGWRVDKGGRVLGPLLFPKLRSLGDIKLPEKIGAFGGGPVGGSLG